MGVDADFYLKGTWTEEQKISFTDAAQRRYLWDEYSRLTEWEDGWLEFRTLNRYYGKGYERGSWPYIYSIFLLLKNHFPETTLFYGGDSMPDETIEMTDERIAELWAHWLSSDGVNYRSRHFIYEEPEKIVDERLERIALEIEDAITPDSPVVWRQGQGAWGRYNKESEAAYRMGWERKKNTDMLIVRNSELDGVVKK